jgi:hypothetical protein
VEKRRGIPIVADGHRRAAQSVEPEIRAAVEREYAFRLREARSLRRWLLRREIAREVRRRLERCAPPGAVYLNARRSDA